MLRSSEPTSGFSNLIGAHKIHLNSKYARNDERGCAGLDGYRGPATAWCTSFTTLVDVNMDVAYVTVCNYSLRDDSMHLSTKIHYRTVHPDSYAGLRLRFVA